MKNVGYLLRISNKKCTEDFIGIIKHCPYAVYQKAQSEKKHIFSLRYKCK